MADQKTSPIKPIIFKPAQETQATSAVKVQVNEPKSQATQPKPNKFAGCQSHTVQDGETLLDIANNWHVALQQLRYFNGLNKNNFRVQKGQVIYKPNKPIFVPLGE